MSTLEPRIIGTGWHLPEKIRLNNDPVFAWLKKNDPDWEKMFDGYEKRHVLSGKENLIDIMVPAAQKALKSSEKKASEIDILIGCGSISQYFQPNVLSEVHLKLGLPASTWVIPVGDDYSNFASSLLIANGLIKSNHAKNILICIGGNWTRNVDYHTPQSISAADGAGAAVVSMSADKSHWYVADQCTVTDSFYYGSMYTDGLPLKAKPPVQGYNTVYSPHFFQITPKGQKGFGAFGEITALTAVTELLKKNKLSGSDISFMPHQTSAVLIDYWVKNLVPAQVLSTIKEIANVTVATHALNLAWFEEKNGIEKDFLVMLALGPDMHANAMLLRRH